MPGSRASWCQTCPTMSPSVAIGASPFFRGRRLSSLSPAYRRGSAPRRHSSLGLLPDAQSRPPANHAHLARRPRTRTGCGRVLPKRTGATPGPSTLASGGRAICSRGRFGAVVMDEPHLLAAARYIALNPMVAGLVSRAEDWHGRALGRSSRARMTSSQRWRRCAH
jgi:hypothetical protein